MHWENCRTKIWGGKCIQRLTVQFCWPEAKTTKASNTFKTENEKMPGPEWGRTLACVWFSLPGILTFGGTLKGVWVLLLGITLSSPSAEPRKRLFDRKIGIATLQRMPKPLESLDWGLLSSQRALQILVCTVKGCSPKTTSSRLPVSPKDGGKEGKPLVRSSPRTH